MDKPEIQKHFDIPALEDFYRTISDPDGIEVTEFQRTLDEHFSRHRSKTDLDDYRLSKGLWKKLADEVSPVSHYFKYRKVCAGRIRFPLNSQPPDCFYYPNEKEIPVGLEVTIAQARERFHLKKEMVETGVGRGFIGVSDDAPQGDFDTAMAKDQTMHETNFTLSSIKEGILRCLARKNQPIFIGCTLIIEAPMTTLPFERWCSIIDELSAKAVTLYFHAVHVISAEDEEPKGFQIK